MNEEELGSDSSTDVIKKLKNENAAGCNNMKPEERESGSLRSL